MGALVGLLGLAGLGLAAAMLVVKAVLKKRWEYKKIGVLAVVALALFVIGLVITPSTKENFDVGREAGRKAATEADSGSLSQKAGISESTIEADDLTKEPDPEDSIPDDKNTSDTIPGLTAADIKLNLQQTWGLQFTGPRQGEDLAQDSGQTVDPDTGATLICNIFETSPLHIQWVDFVINASRVAGIVDVDTINAVTEGYFSYCATLPYDNAEPEKAKEWVKNNVSKATKAGNVIKAQFGPATFQMFGTEYFRTLRVTPNEE